jgi:hypothetical protein
MKIIAVDNFGRETVADYLVCDNIKYQAQGKVMLEALRATCDSLSPRWFELVPDDHRLSRGMEDLV